MLTGVVPFDGIDLKTWRRSVGQGARIDAGIDGGVEELDGVAAGSRQERRRWICEVHDLTGTVVEREK